ncbi:MAG: DUF4296 domain-containing protein [Ignavibacteriaceae bacterium]
MICPFSFKSKNLSFLSLIIISTFIFIFVSCSKQKIIPENIFVKIYTDLVVAQDTALVDSVSSKNLREKILKKYNVKLEDYQQTINYYNEDPERWQVFFDKVMAYVETLKNSNQN